MFVWPLCMPRECRNQRVSSWRKPQRRRRKRYWEWSRRRFAFWQKGQVNATLASSIRVDSCTLNFNSCKFADNIDHCPSQSQEIHKAYTENKKPLMTTITQDPFKEPLKGLFLNGLLITREGQTVKFRPEVNNGCQATSPSACTGQASLSTMV